MDFWMNLLGVDFLGSGLGWALRLQGCWANEKRDYFSSQPIYTSP